MKKKLVIAASVLCIGLVAFGHHGWNHVLGIEAIRGVSYVLGGAVRPAPVVVTPPAVPTTVVTPAPVVTTTTVPAYSYEYYNNVYCPTYQGYYWYNNAWTWGGGYRYRPPIPRWIPPRHHYHHGGYHYAPPPPRHHGGFHGGHRHHR